MDQMSGAVPRPNSPDEADVHDSDAVLDPDDLRHRINGMSLEPQVGRRGPSRAGSQHGVLSYRDIVQSGHSPYEPRQHERSASSSAANMYCLLMCPLTGPEFPADATFRLERVNNGSIGALFQLTIIDYHATVPWSAFSCPISRALRSTYGPDGTIARRQQRRLRQREDRQIRIAERAERERRPARLRIDVEPDGIEFCYSCVTASGPCTSPDGPCPI